MQERLRSLWGKFTEKWNSFEKNQKIKLIAVAVLIGISLALTLVIIFRPKWTTIIENSDFNTVAEVQAALDAENITSRQIQNGNGLEVRESDKVKARVAASLSEDLRNQNFQFEDMLEQNKMGTTDKTRSSMEERVISSEITKMFMYYPGVEKADVRVTSAGENNFLLSENKAQVGVILKTSQPIDANTADAMVELLRVSVKNLSYEDITISDQNGLIFSGSAKNDAANIRTERDVENSIKIDLERQIKEATQPLFDVTTVIMNLDLNWDKIVEQSEEYANPTGEESDKGFVNQEVTSKQNYTNGSPDGEPGLAGNDNEPPTYETQTGEYSEASISDKQADYIYNILNTSTQKQTGKLLKENSGISVYVYNDIIHDEAILRDTAQLEGTTWQEYKTTTPDKQPFEVDEDFIESLRIGTGINNVTVLGFNRNFFVDEVVEPVDFTQIAILVVVGILFLLLAIGLLRMTRPEEVTEEEIEEELDLSTVIATSKLDDALVQEFTEDGEELAEEDRIEMNAESEIKLQIEKFVDEEPEAVAQLLRNWLNEDWEW